MTFSTWLRTQTKRDDAIGDFARDWVLDRSSKKPRGPYGFAALRHYLAKREACRGALNAARKAWDEYMTLPR